MIKQLKIVLLLWFIATACNQFKDEPTPKPVYVIVHGAWGGGWAFKKVDSLLSSSGCIVYRPTLTGQGERVHLATKDVGLNTHISDVVNTILYEDLDNIILVGHSYGGMVITGVADQIPDRISKLVYIDAYIPEDKESLVSISKKDMSEFDIVDEYIIPYWVPDDQPPPKDVPHPIKTWTDPISLENPERLSIESTYILTVEKGEDPKKDNFASQAERAQKNSWKVQHLEADHNAQWSAPEELVNMLLKLDNN